MAIISHRSEGMEGRGLQPSLVPRMSHYVSYLTVFKPSCIYQYAPLHRDTYSLFFIVGDNTERKRQRFPYRRSSCPRLLGGEEGTLSTIRIRVAYFSYHDFI